MTACSLHADLILEGPKSLSVALGENATFKCSARNKPSLGLEWSINDTIYYTCDQNNATEERNCSIITRVDSNPTTEITVNTSYNYNLTQFHCIAYVYAIRDGNYERLEEENSSSALLTVQGMLIPTIVRYWSRTLSILLYMPIAVCVC